MGAFKMINGPKTVARIREQGREPLIERLPSHNDNEPQFAIDPSVQPPFPFAGGKPVEIPRWLIKGVLPEVGVAVLGGQFSSGKTLIGLDVSLSLIYGRPFLGRKVKRGGVLWLAAESQGEIAPRIFAARRERYDDDSNSTIPLQVAESLPTGSTADILTKIEGMIRAAHGSFADACPNHPLRLVVIDTMAAAFLLEDENKNSEAALVMRRLGDIARTYGVLIMPVHHFGKEAGTGLRGASAFSGGADAILACKAGIDPQTGVDTSDRTLSVTKLRGGQPGPLATYSVMSTVIGYDEDRDPETAPYVKFGELGVSIKGESKRRMLSRGDRCFFAALDETILAHGKEHRVHGDGPVVRAVSRELVRKEFARRYVEDGSGNAGSGERSAWKRAFDNAMTAGTVGGEQFNAENALIWRV